MSAEVVFLTQPATFFVATALSSGSPGLDKFCQESRCLGRRFSSSASVITWRSLAQILSLLWVLPGSAGLTFGLRARAALIARRPCYR